MFTQLSWPRNSLKLLLLRSQPTSWLVSNSLFLPVKRSTQPLAIFGGETLIFLVFNDALLAKQVWRLVQNLNSLCAQVLEQTYFPNTHIFQAKKDSSPSWLWSSLLTSRDLLQKGSLWNIGNSCSVNVFSDHWILSIPPQPINLSLSLSNTPVTPYAIGILKHGNSLQLKLISLLTRPCQPQQSPFLMQV